MAIWSRNKKAPSTLNNGNEYQEGDWVTIELFNDANNNAYFAVDSIEALGEAPDVSEAGVVGTPNVTLIPYDKAIDGITKTFKKFKFSNLRGEKGDAGTGALVKQELGTSTDDVVSQKVITDKFDDIDDQLNSVPVSGTSYALTKSLSNTVAGIMQSLVIKGKTETVESVTSSTDKGEVSVIGKNLFDKTINKLLVGYIDTDNDSIIYNMRRCYTPLHIKVNPNTHYICRSNVSGRTFQAVIYYDINKAIITFYIPFETPFLTPSNCEYVRLVFMRIDDTDMTLAEINEINDNTQLELGSTATTYTPYNVTRARYPKLQSVPAIQDTFDVLSGLHTQNVQRYVLTADDILQVVTAPINVDVVNIGKKVDYKFATTATGSTGATLIEGYTEKSYSDSLDNINTYAFNFSSTSWSIVVANSTYASLAAAKTALAGTVIYYQLAEPVLSYYPPKSIPLEVNSSIIHQSIMSDIVFYSTGITISDTDYPINSLQEVYKVDTETGIETPIDIATCTVAVDGLSFTSTALTDGDLVWFRYEHTLDSTVPTTEYTYTTSLAGGLATIQQDTKKQNESLQKQIDELRTVIQSLSI